MLVVFEIPDDGMGVETASALAQRETLWFFCTKWRILQGENIDVDRMTEALGLRALEETPVVEEKKQTKRTTHRKPPTTKKTNGERPV